MSQVSGRRPEFDYLRAAAIVLVVWHHAIIPYATFAYLNPFNPVLTISPVVNGERWAGFDMIAWFNDTFLMSLLFLVSGLFVWSSLSRKGPGRYLADRARRLGIPFLVGVLVLMPLTYYPAQMQVSRVFGTEMSFIDFCLRVYRSGFGTAGPLWFVWLLLAFDGLVVAVYALRARNGSEAASSRVMERPLPFFAALLVLSGAAYLAMASIFGPIAWVGVGPFKVQVGRLLHYLVYFLTGVAAGAYGLNRSVFRPDGPLARQWWLWLLAGAAAFLAASQMSDIVWSNFWIGSAFFVLCSLTLTAASIAVFLQFATQSRPGLENLSRSSYGIYIVHYVIVTWLQYGLLDFDLSPVAKAVLAFVFAVILSWVLVTTLRRIPAVSRVI